MVGKIVLVVYLVGGLVNVLLFVYYIRSRGFARLSNVFEGIALLFLSWSGLLIACIHWLYDHIDDEIWSRKVKPRRSTPQSGYNE